MDSPDQPALGSGDRTGPPHFSLPHIFNYQRLFSILNRLLILHHAFREERRRDAGAVPDQGH